MNGSVTIHRKIMDDPAYKKKPFDEFRAWLDLILLANSKENGITVRGVRVIIRRGQLGWSREKLAERWGWSRNRVMRYLMKQQKLGRIAQQKSKVLSLITVLKYDFYQENGATDFDQNGTQTIDNKEVSEVNAKNESEYTRAREKTNRYLNHVKMSDNEYAGLVKEYGKQNVDDYIERLDNHIGATNKKYAGRHVFVLKGWMKKDKVERPLTYDERLRKEAKEMGLKCHF